jgi:Holliday junction resolvase RusA-like endonuclease
MNKIKIKPLSINDAFQGRRFKTKAYKDYELEALHKLPGMNIPKDTPLLLEIETGFSNQASDLSNILKAFEDILQKKYGFDDKWVYEIKMIKKLVKKGDEYISFDVKRIPLV